MDEKHDSIEIRVRATTQCNALAGSVVAAYSTGKRVVLSAIGPLPVTTAVKAISVANRTLAPRGIMLCVIPALVTRSLPDQHEPTSAERPWVVTLLTVVDLLGGRNFTIPALPPVEGL